MTVYVSRHDKNHINEETRGILLYKKCMQVSSSLLNKYNVQVPRYTSYPTVPFWNNTIDPSEWHRHFITAFKKNNNAEGISLYIHLPFCDSLCTYCGCTKKITTNHNVEEGYIDILLKEWKLYLSLMDEKPVIRELHLGGGTPTFFSPENLSLLLSRLFADSVIHPQHSFSIEGHPNNTTSDHLKILYEHGFRRISYGVQDNDPVVQKIINRIQPFENVKRATETARATGFESVNFDLIYGLPLQTEASITQTITKCLELKPDRIAFYSYAHVPWTSKGQRLFNEDDLPDGEQKLALYQTGKKIFVENGYYDIGMDHFSLPSDELYLAWKDKKLHRNFMGYTTQNTHLLIGLGQSSISDTGTAFAQNNKNLHEYERMIGSGILPVQRGYFLDESDIRFRKYILNISCNGSTSFNKEDDELLKEYTFPLLAELSNDGFINYNEHGITVTELGAHFIRNICSAFDIHLQKARYTQTTPSVYSRAV